MGATSRRSWTGRDIYDVNGRRIGSISDQGHLGARFGTAWLPVETETGNRVLVPVEQVESSDDRLVLPYPKTYIEGAPPRRPVGVFRGAGTPVMPSPGYDHGCPA